MEERDEGNGKKGRKQKRREGTREGWRRDGGREGRMIKDNSTNKPHVNIIICTLRKFTLRMDQE